MTAVGLFFVCSVFAVFVLRNELYICAIMWKEAMAWPIFAHAPPHSMAHLHSSAKQGQQGGHHLFHSDIGWIVAYAQQRRFGKVPDFFVCIPVSERL